MNEATYKAMADAILTLNARCNDQEERISSLSSENLVLRDLLGKLQHDMTNLEFGVRCILDAQKERKS